jgi:predicted PurR-regulated permease PerM
MANYLVNAFLILFFILFLLLDGDGFLEKKKKDLWLLTTTKLTNQIRKCHQNYQVIGMIGAKCLISSGIKILRNTHDASTKKPYFSSKNYT